MSDLTGFLLARIIEDEAAARRAPGPAWRVVVERAGDPGRWTGVGAYLLTLEPADSGGSFGDEVARSVGNLPFAADHIVRWDPARALAECEAKREIIERAEHVVANGCDVCGAVSHHGDFPAHEDDCGGDAALVLAEGTLRALAAPFASHPDFDPAWTVGGQGD